MSWKDRLRVTRNVESILGWPSDTFSVDFRAADACNGHALRNFPHTVLVFIPGNPGLVEWYLPMFVQLVERLGPGFAARGVSNAGHSTKSDSAVNVEQWQNSPDRDISIPWTVDGQVYHKCAYMDTVAHEFNTLKKQWGFPESAESPRFIFVSHSIGVHFTQRLFILRPSILERTRLLISLMPFTRMKAPRSKQRLLDFAAANPEQTIRVHQGLMRILQQMPFQWVDILMQGTMKDKDGRKVAVELVRQPAFARNFFSLGLEEIRDVPEEFDVSRWLLEF
jgi:pimeloyl-ACP methyl ester carboxylesterase